MFFRHFTKGNNFSNKLIVFIDEEALTKWDQIGKGRICCKWIRIVLLEEQILSFKS